MPALPSTTLLNTVISPTAIANLSQSSQVGNVTNDALQVVCAWPVSGQYGPGSRVLYYVLVAACVFARKAEWLRNACLAAALLFPAVAALHGIVLAAVHVDDAVDMDVYGAFQLCSIGILAAPVTVRLSRTYFYDPGRNIIFLWTGVILAGLLSLTVEFYRIKTADCTHDEAGNPISNNPNQFPYSEDSMCGLICSAERGPYSPLRGDSANDIYVVPAPDKLTFGTATLLAAACCIPAILSLVSMWNKILEINWRTRFGDANKDEELIQGTNGATIGKMKGVNKMIRSFLKVVEVPVFGAAVLTILIIGERNFFSSQVIYQTEPIASIGQWAPIVGTGLAALGSLYLLFAADTTSTTEEGKSRASVYHCNCQHHRHSDEQPRNLGRRSADYSPSSRDAQSIDYDVFRNPSQDLNGPPAIPEVEPPDPAYIRPRLSNESAATTNGPAQSPNPKVRRAWTSDAGSRRKVAKTLTSIGSYFGTAAPDSFDDSAFKRGKALDFPEIPGEEQRNPTLHLIREQYNQPRDANGNVTPVHHGQRSRAGSFTSSVGSGLGAEGESPHSSQSPHSQSAFRLPMTHRLPKAATLPVERTSFELQNIGLPSCGTSAGRRLHVQLRRDTLEVPSPTYHSHTRNNPSGSSVTPTLTIPARQSSPAIVVSSGPDSSSQATPPVCSPSTPRSSSEIAIQSPETASPPSK